MKMGPKGAVVMLVVAVLWAAIPALACLTPAAHHSCCHGMTMADCGSPAMMQCGDCCRAQPAGAPLLPGSAGVVDHCVGSAASLVPTTLTLPHPAVNRILPASETPLSLASPGSGSVLRI